MAEKNKLINTLLISIKKERNNDEKLFFSLQKYLEALDYIRL